MGVGSRRFLGITGLPGSGKSTYAAKLAGASPVPAVVLPMDGFHLADSTLRRHGTLDRKGAPETFDALGYAALLHRLHTDPDVVYAPGFDRDLEQPLAGAIQIDPEVELVIAEGNYLLMDRPEWRLVRAELVEVCFLDIPEEVRRPRLIARHIEFGKTPEQAAAWVARVDDANAALISGTRDRADRILDPGTVGGQT